MYVHVRNGEFIQRFPTAKGWVTLENGNKVSPPVAGFVEGNDMVVAEVIDDEPSYDVNTHMLERSEALDINVWRTSWTVVARPVENYSVITKLQCKKQCVIEGSWDTLKAAIAGNADMQEDWDLASSLSIIDPGVQAISLVLGKDAQQLQEFFNAAVKL